MSVTCARRVPYADTRGPRSRRPRVRQHSATPAHCKLTSAISGICPAPRYIDAVEIFRPRRRRMPCFRLLHFDLPLCITCLWVQRQFQAPLVLYNALNWKAGHFQRNIPERLCKHMACFSITSHDTISQLPVWPGERFKLGSRRRSHIAANRPSEFGMIGYFNGGKRRRLCNDST